MIRIDIRDKKPTDPAGSAADIVIATLRAEGVDPLKAIKNTMMRSLALEWSTGRMNEEGFRRSCRNMLVLNPSLAL